MKQRYTDVLTTLQKRFNQATVFWGALLVWGVVLVVVLLTARYWSHYNAQSIGVNDAAMSVHKSLVNKQHLADLVDFFTTRGESPF